MRHTGKSFGGEVPFGKDVINDSGYIHVRVTNLSLRFFCR